MSLPGSGCCCGVIVGIVFSLIMSVLATVGIYCWVNPEARQRGMEAVAEGWDDFKDFGDSIIKKTNKAELPPPPEPGVRVFSDISD